MSIETKVNKKEKKKEVKVEIKKDYSSIPYFDSMQTIRRSPLNWLDIKTGELEEKENRLRVYGKHFAKANIAKIKEENINKVLGGECETFTIRLLFSYKELDEAEPKYFELVAEKVKATSKKGESETKEYTKYVPKWTPKQIPGDMTITVPYMAGDLIPEDTLTPEERAKKDMKLDWSKMNISFSGDRGREKRLKEIQADIDRIEKEKDTRYDERDKDIKLSREKREQLKKQKENMDQKEYLEKFETSFNEEKEILKRTSADIEEMNRDISKKRILCRDILTDMNRGQVLIPMRRNLQVEFEGYNEEGKYETFTEMMSRGDLDNFKLSAKEGKARVEEVRKELNRILKDDLPEGEQASAIKVYRDMVAKYDYLNNDSHFTELDKKLKEDIDKGTKNVNKLETILKIYSKPKRSTEEEIKKEMEKLKEEYESNGIEENDIERRINRFIEIKRNSLEKYPQRYRTEEEQKQIERYESFYKSYEAILKKYEEERAKLTRLNRIRRLVQFDRFYNKIEELMEREKDLSKAQINWLRSNDFLLRCEVRKVKDLGKYVITTGVEINEIEKSVKPEIEKGKEKEIQMEIEEIKKIERVTIIKIKIKRDSSYISINLELKDDKCYFKYYISGEINRQVATVLEYGNLEQIQYSFIMDEEGIKKAKDRIKGEEEENKKKMSETMNEDNDEYEDNN